MGPTLLPSTRNWTPVTVPLSEATAVRLTFPDSVAPAAGEVTCTDGGVLLLPVVENVWSELAAESLPLVERTRK